LPSTVAGGGDWAAGGRLISSPDSGDRRQTARRERNDQSCA
jgi:hypothetical protein